jgi:hypothetical protein
MSMMFIQMNASMPRPGQPMWCIYTQIAPQCRHRPNFGLVMARSPISPDRRSVRTSVMLPEDVHTQVQALADSHHVSSAWVIRMAVQRFLDDCNNQSESPLRLPNGQGTN